MLWGPIGDRFGRRAPIAGGLVLFVIGSAGCAMAESAAAIIAWRVAQAVGACAGGSALVAAFADGTLRPMAWVIACSGVGRAVCAWWLTPQPARAPVEPPVSPKAVNS